MINFPVKKKYIKFKDKCIQAENYILQKYQIPIAQYGLGICKLSCLYLI